MVILGYIQYTTLQHTTLHRCSITTHYTAPGRMGWIVSEGCGGMCLGRVPPPSDGAVIGGEPTQRFYQPTPQ